MTEQLLKFVEQPPTPQQVKQIAANVAGYDATAGYVDTVWKQLITWRRKIAGNRLSIDEHLKDLINLAKSIRSCIERPNLDEEADYHQLMNVRGYDWRLDPAMWFDLCTPDLSKVNSWGIDPALLKSHIESNPLKKSPFWEHLDQLWQKVKALENDYDKMAVEIMAGDGEFKKYWESIQLERVKRERSEVHINHLGHLFL